MYLGAFMQQWQCSIVATDTAFHKDLNIYYLALHRKFKDLYDERMNDEERYKLFPKVLFKS